MWLRLKKIGCKVNLDVTRIPYHLVGATPDIQFTAGCLSDGDIGFQARLKGWGSERIKYNAEKFQDENMSCLLLVRLKDDQYLGIWSVNLTVHPICISRL